MERVKYNIAIQTYMEELLSEFKEDWYMIKIGGYSL